MTKEEKRTIVENIQHAEDYLDKAYWDICEASGFSKETKKLDTIIGKVYDLKIGIDRKRLRK